MKRTRTITLRLRLAHDELYSPADRWEWREMLDLDPEDTVDVSEDDPRFDPILAQRLAE